MARWQMLKDALALVLFLATLYLAALLGHGFGL